MSSEEADLLREMITDRDRRIAMVKQKTSDLDEKQQRLLDELDSATELTARQQITHQTEKTKLLHNLHLAEEHLGTLEADMQQQGSSLAAYANMVSQQHNDDGISPVTPSNVDQNTVMRMQAQLCKAMHSMGILDHQLQLTTDMCEARLKMLRDAMAEQRESKAQLELQLLNDMMKADTEKREVESGLKKQVKDLQGQVKTLERGLGEDESESDSEEDDEDKDDDEEEEDDEETKKAKEEMQKLLEQRREQVVDLEKQLDTQEEELSKLRETLGEDLVDAPEERPPPPKNAPPPPPEEDNDSESEANEEEEENNGPDEVATRLAQVMENAKLEDVEKAGAVDEFDLLKMAQNRLAGASADEEGEDDDESSSEEESDEEDEDSEDEGGENEAAESADSDQPLSGGDEEPLEAGAPDAEDSAAAVDDPDQIAEPADTEPSRAGETPEEEEKKTADEEDTPSASESTEEKPTENGVHHNEGEVEDAAA